MNIKKIALSGMFFLLLMQVVQFSRMVKLQADTNPSNTDVGATVNSSIQMTLSEGVNQFGKRTTLLGNNIDFGSVTFTHPEAVSNGDAYLENGFLRLEAVMNVGVTFGGASSVAIQMKKLKVSANPFHQVYYALSADRSSADTKVMEDPQTTTLSTLTRSESFPLKLIFEVNPTQKGRLTERVRLEANAL